ncbi:hypothetical protein [Ferruginibacter sp.]
MKHVLTVLFLAFTASCFAQTKLIAFKSHSGNISNFNSTLNNELFDDEASNFGGPAFKWTYKLDSVIHISPEKSLLVQRIYQRYYTEPIDSNKLARMARDTVYNDALFSRHHSLDSIKAVLISSRRYDSSLKKTIFVGYDNHKPKEKKKEKAAVKETPKENFVLPVYSVDNNNDGNNAAPFDGHLLQLLAGALLLALLGGWISWKFRMPQLQKA